MYLYRIFSLFSPYNLPDSCARYGKIEEDSSPRFTPICIGKDNLTQIYHSVTHSVRIQLVSQQLLRGLGSFFLYYEGL